MQLRHTTKGLEDQSFDRRKIDHREPKNCPVLLRTLLHPNQKSLFYRRCPDGRVYHVSSFECPLLPDRASSTQVAQLAEKYRANIQL